eukprot:69694_1
MEGRKSGAGTEMLRCPVCCFAAEPKVDRTTVHDESSAIVKWKIKKSKWPCSINSAIIVSLKAFGANDATDFTAAVSPGNACLKTYGIEPSNQRHTASEDDVLHTQHMHNFDNALNDQEAEALFGALTCEYIRIPMLVKFFDRDHLTCLCAQKIQTLLEGGLFEPGHWGNVEGLSNAFTFAPVKHANELATEN